MGSIGTDISETDSTTNDREISTGESTHRLPNFREINYGHTVISW